MQLLHLATGRPVVWDAHEVYTNVMVEYNQFGWKPLSRIGARFFGWYERWASRHSFAGVVTITDAMAERYRDLGKPVAAVGNFAEDEALAATPAAGARRGDPPLIVTTGLLSADRGVYLMLQALELLRPRLPCRLALWGAFDSVAEQTQFLATAERLGLGDLVHVSGPYPRNTLLTELLPTASVACVLYLQRQDYNRLTIPNRLTEYWACRLPVITTDDTFAGRMTSATGGGLLTDNSPADLAAQLERLLRDPAAARAMGERGREGVLSTYNWDAAFKELRTLYTRILGPLST
jgi:glycosyltransferase involved in cell wall biosynthesis